MKFECSSSFLIFHLPVDAVDLATVIYSLWNAELIRNTVLVPSYIVLRLPLLHLNSQFFSGIVCRIQRSGSVLIACTGDLAAVGGIINFAYKYICSSLDIHSEQRVEYKVCSFLGYIKLPQSIKCSYATLQKEIEEKGSACPFLVSTRISKGRLCVYIIFEGGSRLELSIGRSKSIRVTQGTKYEELNSVIDLLLVPVFRKMMEF